MGSEQEEALLKMKQFARTHPLTLEDVKKLVAQDPKDAPVHRQPEECYVKIPIGFEVGLTYEEQEEGYMWHASFSVDQPGRFPNEHAVEMICAALRLPSFRKAAVIKLFDEVVNVWWLDDDTPPASFPA